MTRLRFALLISLLALTASAGAASPALAGTLPPIRHVFVIMLENKTYAETFGANSAAPYLARTLPSEGALVPNYYGVTHESLGNYIALISGQGSNPATQIDCVVTYSDVFPGLIGPDGQALGAGCVYPKSVTTVANQLNAGGLSWKGYMEDMGTACRHPALDSRDPNITATVGDQYATRHNPFVYFHSIIDTPACAQDDVPLAQLSADLTSASTTPNLAFITPNLCHDGHDSPCVDGQPGGLRSVNAFLTTWVPRILHSPAYRAGGLLAILFERLMATTRPRAATSRSSRTRSRTAASSPVPAADEPEPCSSRRSSTRVRPTRLRTTISAFYGPSRTYSASATSDMPARMACNRPDRTCSRVSGPRRWLAAGASLLAR